MAKGLPPPLTMLADHYSVPYEKFEPLLPPLKSSGATIVSRCLGSWLPPTLLLGPFPFAAMLGDFGVQLDALQTRECPVPGVRMPRNEAIIAEISPSGDDERTNRMRRRADP